MEQTLELLNIQKEILEYTKATFEIQQSICVTLIFILIVTIVGFIK